MKKHVQEKKEKLILERKSRSKDIVLLSYLQYCEKIAEIKFNANMQHPTYETLLDMANATHNLGDAYFYIGDYKNAIVFYQRGQHDRLHAFTEKQVIKTMADVITVHLNVVQDVVTVSLNIVDSNSNINNFEENNSIISGFCNIGNMHYLMHDNDNAIKSYKEALGWKIKAHNIIPNVKEDNQLTTNQLESLREFAAGHHNIGDIYYEKGDYENALLHYQKGLEIKFAVYEETSEVIDIRAISAGFKHIGIIYYVKKEYDNANIYFKLAYDYMHTAHVAQENDSEIMHEIADINIHINYVNLTIENNKDYSQSLEQGGNINIMGDIDIADFNI